MEILEIPVRFQKGNKIYTTKMIKPEIPCHICEGNGTIRYKEKDMRCPECMGVGTFTSRKSTNIVCDEPFTISSIKISVNSNDEISVKYKGQCGFTSLNRAENNLFETKEEAQIRCDELNREKVYIKVDDIVIQDYFKEAHPSMDKIQAKLNHYEINRKFDKEIIIDKQNVLKDGYVNYLLCKLLNIKYVIAIVEN